MLPFRHMPGKTSQNNFAFIDGQNLYLGLKARGWRLDFRRFRIYLRDKYHVAQAYWFIGYVQENQPLYTAMQQAGFILMFKEVSRSTDGEIKGNIDVNLTLHVVDKMPGYDSAVLVTSDGDFADLVRYLDEKGKFALVLSPHRETCSYLLRKAAGARVRYIDDVRGKLEHK